MKESKITYLQRAIAAVLVIALFAPFSPRAAAQQQPVQQQQPAQQDQQAQQPASANGQQNPQQQQPAQPQTATANESDTPNAPAPSQQQSSPVVPGLETRPTDPAPGQQQFQDNPNARPVGTAAAPLTRPTGIAASRPAGAAIAPGKQKRVRPIVIRVAIIVGAAAAIGAVAGLSKSSPSRP